MKIGVGTLVLFHLAVLGVGQAHGADGPAALTLDPVTAAFRTVALKLGQTKRAAPETDTIRMTVARSLDERSARLKKNADAQLSRWGSHGAGGRDVAPTPASPTPESQVLVLTGDGTPEELEFKPSRPSARK